MKKKYLFTFVRPLKVGNQSLIKNIRPIIENGFNVTAFLYRYRKDQIDIIKHEFPELTIYSFMDRSREYEKKYKTSKNLSPYKDLLFSREYKLQNDLNQWFKTLPMLFMSVLITFSFISRNKIKRPDLIVGYEVSGWLVGFMISKIFFWSSKYYAVLQGTSLVNSRIKSKFSLIKEFLVSHPVDVLFWLLARGKLQITDDGTRGKSLALRLGLPSFDIISLPNAFSSTYRSYKIPPKIKELRNKGIKHIYYCSQRFVIWKRHDRLVEFMSQMKKKPEIFEKSHIICAGGGHLENYFFQLIQKKKLIEKFTILGQLKFTTNLAYIKNCDAIITCNDVSNLSNSVIESVQFKTPVIALDNGSLNSFVEEFKLKNYVYHHDYRQKKVIEFGVIQEFLKLNRNVLHNPILLDVNYRNKMISEHIKN